MDIDAKFKAAGFLLVASFIGGFLVVHKASAMFHSQSVGPDNNAGGDRNSSGGGGSAGKQGSQVAVSMDGDDDPANAGKGQQQGKGQGQAAGDDDEDGAMGQGAKVVKIDKKKKTSSGSDDDSTIDGAAAIGFLAGNSVRLEARGTSPHFIYYAARGLLGESDDHGFRVRRWLERGGELCTTNAAGTLDCAPIKVVVLHPKAASKPGKAKAAAKPNSVAEASSGGKAIGLLIVNSAKFTIFAGNVAKFPAYIPTLDPAPDVKTPAFNVVTAAGRLVGRPAWEKIVGMPLASASKDLAGARRFPRITYYDPAGSLLEIARDSIESAEVDLAIAKWTFRNDALCQGGPGVAQKRCQRPELADGELSNLTDSKGEALSLYHLSAPLRSVAMETLGAIHSTLDR